MNTTPVFQKSYDFYKQLYINLRQIPKRDRFTWGEKCDEMAICLIKSIAESEFSQPQQKRLLLKDASRTVDLLKIYIRLGFELRILDQKKYISIQNELQEIGKMLGGWIKSV
jgi:four helix bundle protein